jgi:hypothetical protein
MSTGTGTHQGSTAGRPAVDPWRVPEVEALATLRPERSVLAGRFTLRHLLAMLAVAPLVVWWFRSAMPATLDPTPGWWAALGAMGLLGGATLATYVPRSRTARGGGARGGACGAPAVLLLVLAALTLGGATPTVLSAVPALVLAGTALGARLVTAATCR